MLCFEVGFVYLPLCEAILQKIAIRRKPAPALSLSGFLIFQGYLKIARKCIKTHLKRAFLERLWKRTLAIISHALLS